MQRVEDALLGDVESVVHQIEEDFVLALEMMVEAAFAELEGRGYVVHRGGVVALLLEKTSGNPQNLLAWIENGLASHAGTEYTERGGNTSEVHTGVVALPSARRENARSAMIQSLDGR